MSQWALFHRGRRDGKVELNSGNIGYVILVKKGTPSRPVAKWGKSYGLSQNYSLSLQKVLSE
ncbi:MAG: hypothetical protein PHP06_07390 [Clostridia bacterium]|nr:hypothetical protein [Clostridia bacterium]